MPGETSVDTITYDGLKRTASLNLYSSAVCSMAYELFHRDGVFTPDDLSRYYQDGVKKQILSMQGIKYLNEDILTVLGPDADAEDVTEFLAEVAAYTMGMFDVSDILDSPLPLVRSPGSQEDKYKLEFTDPKRWALEVWPEIAKLRPRKMK